MGVRRWATTEADTGTPEISRRPVPGTSLDSSALGFRLASAASSSRLTGPSAAAQLRSARGRGITTFETGSGEAGARAERWVATAFPAPDPDLLVLVTRSVRSLSEEQGHDRAAPGDGDLATQLRHSLERSAARLRPQSIGLVRWDPADDPSTVGDTVVPALEGLRAEGLCAGWVMAVRPDAPMPEAGVAAQPGPSLWSGALSLLDTTLLGPLEQRAARGRLGFFAEDPLGSGRLDGSRFSRSVADRRPDARPIDVRALRREFGPVLRLGFLTEGGRRTLAQAALRFVLRWPWVVSALVPLPPPERLVELGGVERSPPLSDSEVDRILRRER